MISIHALLAESDVSFMLYDTSSLIFLSTLSLRRATESQPPCERPTRDFYPRSPCGERPAIDVFLAVWAIISIHALLAESDCFVRCHCWGLNEFLSTLSLRRATRLFRRQSLRCAISIHALLAESDCPNPVCIMIAIIISIHALLAESDECARGPLRARAPISIHALLAESDTEAQSLAVTTVISIHALLAESD